MKYMGSKRAMLQNGLGALLDRTAPRYERFFDLFCGTGAVSGYVARRHDMHVYASDLQEYAVVLAGSLLGAVECINFNNILRDWHLAAEDWLMIRGLHVRRLAGIAPRTRSFIDWRRAILRARAACAEMSEDFFLTRAYGGYYFSPRQAMQFDALRATLPQQERTRSLASLIGAASTCSASPGHTAQPLGISDAALPHVAEAWGRSPFGEVINAIRKTGDIGPKRKGTTAKSEAAVMAHKLKENDLAFIDPPYSEVQYSRFYHVLEAVATGVVGPVTGSGRYPAAVHRPQSEFCRITKSRAAFEYLMKTISSAGAAAIVTFPSGQTSNGLSGPLVQDICEQFFQVKKRRVESLFSTLGGKAPTRGSRLAASELILYLEPL